MNHKNFPQLPQQEYPQRWEKVRSLMDKHNLGLVIAYADDHATYGPAHARWLANFPVYFEPVLILFSKKPKPVLLCGPESDEYARLVGQIPDVRILKEFSHPDEDYKYTRFKGLSEIVADISDINKIKRIGIAGRYLIPGEMFSTLKRAFLSAEWVDIETDFSLLRAVKTPAELKVIKYAYKIAELGMNAAIKAIKPGITEREVAAEAESAMRRAGAEGAGVDTIVASGPNTKPILARSTFRKIKPNDLVLITVTPRYEGYHGAIGRPVIVGKPGPEIIHAVKTARIAQNECARIIRPGIDGCKLEAIGRKILAREGLEKYFLYSGVHSVGVIEFELPIFGPTKHGLLKKGMVISVDIPMFNTPWGGLRVEDGYYITQNGAERLNHTPYEIYQPKN